jgi:threonine aldolase
MIDLRSDTLTRPTPEMRKAMAEAEVGDDVFGEDPTVNELQAFTAELLGKEAALYVASGTMGNQLSVRAATQPGDEVILEAGSHPFNYESAALAGLSGVQAQCVRGERGIMDPGDVARAVRTSPDHHFPPTTMILVENTHNRGGGTIYPMETIDAICRTGRERGIHLHLDGARLWNACAATGIPPAEYASRFDSVSVCLSKGLGAPVGSVVAGGAAFIDRVHRFRKMVGGGMRQAGIIAAAGLHALRHHRKRLVEDHEKARVLAEAVRGAPGVEVLEPQTNILILDVERTGRPARESQDGAERAGVRILAVSETRLRAVTHLDVSPEEAREAAGILGKLLRR